MCVISEEIALVWVWLSISALSGQVRIEDITLLTRWNFHLVHLYVQSGRISTPHSLPVLTGTLLNVQKIEHIPDQI